MNPLSIQGHTSCRPKGVNCSIIPNNSNCCPKMISWSNLITCMPPAFMRSANHNYGKSKHAVHHVASSNLNANCRLLVGGYNYFPLYSSYKHKVSAIKALQNDMNAQPASPNYGSSATTATIDAIDSQNEGAVEWEGSILLEKLNFLDLNNIVADFRDKFSELLGSRVYLQLVSSTSLDPATGEGKRSEKAYLEDWFQTGSTLRADTGTSYKVHFKVDKEFGVPGSILVENQHSNPFFLRSMTFTSTTSKRIKFPCNSWIYNPTLSNGARIFFCDQCYLPRDTPVGVRRLRRLELENKRGDGTGERVTSDRVYDYSVYNDLGNPDKGDEYARLVLGDADLPYPRRCRTGRPSTKADPTAESPLNVLGNVYVPRDEQFDRIKQSDFLGSGLKSVIHVVFPFIRMLISFGFDFKSYEEVHDLYSREAIKSLREKINPIEPADLNEEPPLEFFRELTDPSGGETTLFKFPVPQIIQVNERVWCDDDEFARQLLVGVNPVVVQRLTEFPPTSNLNPTVYGPPLSAITKNHIEGNMEGLSVNEVTKSCYDGALHYCNT
eukprot:c21058_g1_i1 orf=1107-2765(-)